MVSRGKRAQPRFRTRHCRALLQKGFLLFSPVGAWGQTVKIAPPLILPRAALKEGLTVLREATDEAVAAVRGATRGGATQRRSGSQAPSGGSALRHRAGGMKIKGLRWYIARYLTTVFDYMDRQTLALLAQTLEKELGINTIQCSYITAVSYLKPVWQSCLRSPCGAPMSGRSAIWGSVGRRTPG